jgi:hypothetical protein
MKRSRRLALCLAVGIASSVRQTPSQELRIGIIDFYGLSRVSAADARRVLTFKEGDTLSLSGDEHPPALHASERQLARLPGVAGAHLDIVCCDAGAVIVYVGIHERGQSTPRFRPAPRGNVRLAADIVRAGEEFSNALAAAVQRGEAAEDDSQGHALARDAATRAIQDRFLAYAARDLTELRRVLRESSDDAQRALAAQVLGYVPTKQAVVNDLIDAMADASATVRNNAMRALAVFARIVPAAGRSAVRVPYGPFIQLLLSMVWTDRNKASLALAELSERRDPDLLAQLRRQALTPLIEMARWKSPGHAMPALFILGRLGKQPDVAIQAAVDRGDREGIIKAALEQRP